MSDRITLLQHAPFEGPGAIERWAAANGKLLDIVRLDEGAALPAPDSVDALIVMGGPMGVGDGDRIDFIDSERAFINEVLNRQLPVLGVCLGAQLIASVRGADVYPNHVSEVGWFPVNWSSDAERLIDASLNGETLVFHWHSETFELPRGATQLASSEACEIQGFFLPPRCVGLQFHLDSTPELIAGMIANCPEDLEGGAFVQDAAEMLADESRFMPLHQTLERILERLFGP